jgi:multicomponent Na+:H+ antiporter subunit B
MIKRLLILVTIILLALAFFPLMSGMQERAGVGYLAESYLQSGAADLNAPNLVTAVIVTYRGLDTLGEVTVLFTAAAGIALVFGRRSRSEEPKGEEERQERKPSELLTTGAGFLLPLITLFGIYIFVHGHLTPGGGFQGGVIIASGAFFALVAGLKEKLSHAALEWLEMLAGAGYVAVGLLGIWLAAGFLDPRFLPAGEFGSLFSAAAIPLIYSLIGIKVGAELSGVIDTMKRSRT